MIALPPDCVRWINRNGEDNDCAVAAISLATGNSYEQVLGAAMGLSPDVLVEGLSVREIRDTLTALGHDSRLRRKFDLEEDTGILIIAELKNDDERHAVYLWEGRIVEPSLGRRSLWLDAKNYITHEKAKACWLIEVKPKQETSELHNQG